MSKNHVLSQRNGERGFSLLQLTIIISVLSIIAVSALPHGEKDSVTEKYRVTSERLTAIENALKGYRAAYGKLPCPADSTLEISFSFFGQSAASPTNPCTGGSPTSTFGPTSGVVGGMIPVRDLQLPVDYAFDGFDNRFTYVVDFAKTDVAACQTAYRSSTDGVIEIRDDPVLANSYSKPAMYAVISHGENSHGAFPMNANTTIAGRFNATNSGTVSDGERLNAFVNAAFALTVSNVLVSKPRDATFDDMLLYGNKCCEGSICNPDAIVPDLYVTTTASPYFHTYSVGSGNVFTKLTDPSSVGTVNNTKISIEKSNQYVVKNSSAAPYMEFYKTLGLVVNKLADYSDAAVATNNGQIMDMRISPSGTYIALAGNSMPGVQLKILKRTGDVFSLLVTPSGPDAVDGASHFSVSWDSTSNYLATTHFTAPYFRIFSRNGDVFTRSTGVTINGAYPGTEAYDAEFSKTQGYLAFADATAGLVIYKHSGSTFTLLAGAEGAQNQISTTATRVAWSHDSRFIAVYHNIAPWIGIYERSGDVFNRIITGPNANGLDVAVANDITDMSFSNDSKYLAVARTASPYLVIYKRNGSYFEKLPDLVPALTARVTSVTWKN